MRSSLLARLRPLCLSTAAVVLSCVLHAEDSPVSGDAAPAAPDLVTNVFLDSDLRQALADVAAQTGKTIIPEETVQGTISLELKGVPLKKALELMLAPGGYLFDELEPGIFLVVGSDPRAPGLIRLARSEVVELDYIQSEDLQALLPDSLTQYCKFDKESSRVVVTAPQALRQMAIAEIKALDTPPVQVLIEALVLETSLDALRDFQVSLQGAHVGFSTGSSSVSYVGSVKRVLHSLRWLSQEGLAQIRANPRVVAQEGKEAKVEVSVEQYFQVLNPGVVYSYAQLEQISATIALTITPRVAQQDRRITCEIKPEVGDVTGTGANDLPIITKRTVTTTVRVHDGEVIIIGGLLQEVKRDNLRKIPILGDLPLVGGLFRSTHRSSTQRETVVFVVPHILDESGSYEGPSLFEALPANGRTVPKAGAAAAPSAPPAPSRGPAEPSGEG